MAFLETSNLETDIDIIEQQQHFCDLFGHSSSIVYDCYTSIESLARKIDLILPQKSDIERSELTASIWNLNAYNGGNCLFMAPIYITLAMDHKPQVQKTIMSKKFQVHPVFRVRKCSTNSPIGDNGANCCALFVDESARVYMNWTDFRSDNVYDDGLVVAPFNGIYNVSDNRVKLEFFERRAGITKSLDRSSMIIGLSSAGIGALTLIPAITIAPMVVVGAAAAGLSCAVYTGIRGIYNLYDRKKHKQTIKFTNPEARSSYINIAAGAFSASAASATQLLAKAAHGTTGMTNIMRSTAHALNAGALGLHTTGCVDDIYLMITKMYELKSMSTMELSQLSTVLYLLTHSVKNQHTAEKMLQLAKACELMALKVVLRESQKLAVNALVHETMRIQGRTADEKNTVGHITVRSLKNHIDPKPILMELDSDSEDGTVKTNDRKESFKNDYLKMFEARISAAVKRALTAFKTRSENELKLLFINVMEQVSVHLFDDFMALVEASIEKYGTMAEDRSRGVVTFEHLTIMILKQLNVIAKDNNVTDLKEYLSGLTEAERGVIDERIREYFDHLKDEHVQNANDLLAAHINISDDDKIRIAIDGEVDSVIHKFEDLNIVSMKADLRETVKDVLLSMPLAPSHVFFGIVTKFATKNATRIQNRLGRFIPIDIFMTDIHWQLKQMSADCGQELEHYLLDYNDDVYEDIEKKICQFYDNQLVVGDTNKCSHCAGVYFTSA